MKLSKKTFLYSIILAAGMVALVIVYFVLMLPSLYVDYVMDSNLQSVVDIQEGYMEKGNYEGLEVKNPSAVYTMEIPMEGEQVYITGKFLKLTLTVQDEELLEILDHFRMMMKGGVNLEQMQEGQETEENEREVTQEELTDLWNRMKDKFLTEDMVSEEYPVKAELELKTDQGVYREEYHKFHRISDEVMVYEYGISDEDYGYTTYVAMGKTEKGIVFTVLPAMTPSMEEITPVVISSLPMIVTVVFLAVLVASGFFSRKIVNPVIRLAESYLELEEQNRILEEENERQEVFMRASSHQLKTPVAAALLLVEGMINEVGKYKDAKAYLPEVKKQLLSMRKIVEDILDLNHHARNPEKETVAIEGLTKEVLKAYEVQMESRKLMLTVEGSKSLQTDREMMKKIIDNLVSNSVQHTKEGERIEIEINEESLRIRNYGSHIEEKLLSNIFEPFVSSDTREKGKGLGLYVAAYYCRVLNCALKIRNMEGGVEAELVFEKVGKICGEKEEENYAFNN